MPEEIEMPIKATLQNIDGTRRLGSVVDSDGGLNRSLPLGDQSFPLLQYVDPYGNTMLNCLQMPQLLEELQVLISRCSDQESKSLLERVRELALECRNARHLYLRFVGD
jgi:hypothetical protein